MARQRRVEPEKALDAAMRLFWEHGYCDTGTRKIEAETGITRFSLQTDYGGKHGLLVRVLDRYLDMFEMCQAPPAKPESVEELINWFKMSPDDEDMAKMSANGCLLLASVSELDTMVDGIDAQSQRFFSLMRARFESALEHLVHLGQLDIGLPTKDAVELLLSLAISTNMLRRAQRKREAGDAATMAAVALIQSWTVAKAKDTA